MRISDWSSDVCSSDLVRLRSLVAPVAGPEGAPGALRPLAAEVLPRQGAGRQRGVSQQADLFANRHLGKPRLIAAVEQAVGILNRHHARAAPLSGEREETHHAPGILVGEADLAHLAGLPPPLDTIPGFPHRRPGAALRVPIS